MAWSWLPLAGGALGAGGILVSAVQAIANRKLIGANTVETLTKTTAQAAEQLATQLNATRRELAEERAYRRDRDELTVAHEKWDRLIVRTAERMDPPIPLIDPPPLWPEDDPSPTP